DRGRGQFHLDGAVRRQGALLDLGDALWMSQYPLDPAGRRCAHEPDLRVQRTAVGTRRGALAIGEERLADVVEDDLLGVTERLDGRIFACTLTRPRAQQGSKNGDVRVQVGHDPQGTGGASFGGPRRIAGPRNVPSWPSRSPA